MTQEQENQIRSKVTMDLTTAAVLAGACQAVIDLGLDKELTFKICLAISLSKPKWNDKMLEVEMNSSELQNYITKLQGERKNE